LTERALLPYVSVGKDAAAADTVVCTNPKVATMATRTAPVVVSQTFLFVILVMTISALATLRGLRRYDRLDELLGETVMSVLSFDDA
jgi:hypothetical protein